MTRSLLTISCHALLAAAALGQQGPSWQGRTVGQWAARLAADDERARWYAAYALGRIGPDAAPAVGPLMKILETRPENEYVRGTAAWALGRIGTADRPVVELLIETLGSTGHVSVRRNSSRALGRLGAAAKPAVPRLVALLNDPDATVRVNAAAALWHIDRHGKAMAALVQMSRGQDGAAAYAAVEALGQIGGQDDAVVPALAAALRHPVADVRRAAAAALAEIGPATIDVLKLALADQDQDVRRQAVEALGRIGPNAVSLLVDPLKDESPPVRRAAARALGRLGPKAQAAESALIEAVNDPDHRVQEAAARALGRIRSG